MEYLPFLGFLAANFAAASTGGIFKPGVWYDNLAKPPWCPPNWLFAPAWGVLFLMITTSGWLVWKEVGLTAVFGFYALQLVLNAIWSALFFGLKRPDIAFGELILLWLAILANILAFAPISTAAAWLLVPYISWVSFAGVLNFFLWRLNPAVGSYQTQ